MSENSNGNGQNVFATGVAGVVVGATVGSVAALTLSKASNRQKIKTKAYQMNDMMKKKGQEVISKLHKNDMEAKVDIGIDTASEKIKESEKTILDEVDKAVL